MNVRECVEPNNVALQRNGTAELCCQEGVTEHGKMDQWQSLANEQNRPAGQETAELKNVTLHSDNINS